MMAIDLVRFCKEIMKRLSKNDIRMEDYRHVEMLDDYYTKDETDDLLDEKQDALTFDAVPTEDSANPVTSGGLHTKFLYIEADLAGKANRADLASVATSGSYNDLSNKPMIPTVPINVSAFNNDAGYLTTETDPTVPSWAKQSTKPTYNGGEIKYTGTTGNVVTNNTTLNVALKAIDDTIGNVVTLLSNI